MENITLNTLSTTAQVAQNYGISQDTIRDHLKNHSDEILENIHFILKTNKFNNKVIKWTLKGIVVLGFFIRSPQAKKFRIWASELLEKELLKQAQEFKKTRERNLALTDKISELEAYNILQTKKHKQELDSTRAGYKSQISRHNTQIATLKRELKKAQKADIFASLDLSEAKFQPFSQHRPSYKELWFECINILGERNGLKAQNEALRAQNEKLALQNKRLLLILGNINAQTAQLAQI